MIGSALLAEPDFHTAPAYSRTLGDEVGDLCRQVGYAPYPEQQLLLDDTFALDPDVPNRSAAFEIAAVCARQNLKTGYIKQASLGWLFLTDQQLVVWSAHEFSTAQESFRDMSALIESSAMLTRRVKRIYRGNGDESIELMSGARLNFKARTGGGGRGLTGDKVILDEAFALKPEHMGALLPTLLAVQDPQVVYGSSAGLKTSDILRAIRDRGRPGSLRLAYAEWCAERRPCASPVCTHLPGVPGCALDNRELWRQANPVHYRRDPRMETIAALRLALPPEEFARECLGWWDDPPEGGGVIDLAQWRACESAPADVEAPLVLAIETTPDRASTVFVVTGKRADGLPQWEAVENRAGTGWVPERCAEIVAQHGVAAVVMDGKGAAASLIPDVNAAIESLGLEVVTTSAPEVGEACGQAFDAIRDGTVRHLGEPLLNVAVDAAETRPLGDGAWAWSRKHGGPAIAPLVAATLGLWKWRELASSVDALSQIW